MNLPMPLYSKLNRRVEHRVNVAMVVTHGNIPEGTLRAGFTDVVLREMLVELYNENKTLHYKNETLETVEHPTPGFLDEYI